MKHHLMRGLVVGIIAIPLLIASCSKDDKGTTPDTAPVLTVPQFVQAVNFVGADAAIQSAKAKVQSEIALATPIFATAASLATAANSGQWGAKADGCWSKSSSQGNCTTTHKVCEGMSGAYDWSRTLNGNCSGTDHSNWSAADGTTGADGGSGVLRLYKDNTADVDSLWVWSTAADKNSKDWNVYHGTESAANRLASLHWAKGSGSSANTWTFEKAGTSATLSTGVSSTDPAKWELHVSTDAKTGSMDIYQWQAAASPAAFWRSDRIAWNPDPSGQWVHYTPDGDSTSTTWPATLPDVVIPTIGHDIVINSNDECALLPKIIAQSQVTIVHSYAAFGASFLQIFDSLQLGDQVDGCWSWTYPIQTCNQSWRLCEESGGYRWQLTYDGSCPGGTYSNWVVAEGTFSDDGRVATFTTYEEGTTVASGTWSWSTAADGKSGTFVYYTGEVSEANKEMQVTWSVANDGSTDLISEYFDAPASKWETHISSDGTSGFARFFEWDENPPAHYRLQEEIIWNSDGTGSDTTYMEDGTIMTECTWN